MLKLAPPATSGEVALLRSLVVRKRWQEALRLGERLLAHDLDPRVAEGLASRLLEAKLVPDAIRWLRAAVANYPDNVTLQCLLGDALSRHGELREAAAVFIAVIEADPLCAQAHSRLSAILIDLGLFGEAKVACELAIRVLPDLVEARESLGHILELTGDTRAALDAYSAALSLKPGLLRARRRRALLLVECGDLTAALPDLEALTIAHPNDIEMRFVLSRVLSGLGRTKAAIEQLRRILAVRPAFASAHTNLGSLLRKTGQFASAEQALKQALKLQMNSAVAWNNLGNLYTELCRLDEAQSAYSRAIHADENYVDAHVARAMLLLLRGRFKEGWAEYEWRLKHPSQGGRVYNHHGLSPASCQGRRILLCAEQGAGDTFQFVRYAAELAKAGAQVFLECPKALHVLMQELPELSGVVANRRDVPGMTDEVPLMSLPLLFDTNASNVPASIPYLRVPMAGTVPAALRNRENWRVGFVWAGNRLHANDHNRSIPPALIAPLAAYPAVRAFSLQVDGSSDCPEQFVDLAPDIRDYGDTAAILTELDLLISVDTSVAHLAGALGRPVWLLLPACNDWRWLEGRSDSPWYPTMRLFRQQTLGDWRSVVEAVSAELGKLVENGKHNEQ